MDIFWHGSVIVFVSASDIHCRERVCTPYVYEKRKEQRTINGRTREDADEDRLVWRVKEVECGNDRDGGKKKPLEILTAPLRVSSIVE